MNGQLWTTVHLKKASFQKQTRINRWNEPKETKIIQEREEVFHSAYSEIDEDYCTQKNLRGSCEEEEIRKRDRSFTSLICNCWNKELSKWLEDTVKDTSQRVKKGEKEIT